MSCPPPPPRPSRAMLWGLLLGTGLTLAPVDPAEAVTGIVPASGKAVTQMARCRRRAESLTVPIRFLSETRWEATLGNALAAGSYTASTRRRLTDLTLSVDPAARAGLQAELQARIAAACGARETPLDPITVSSFRGRLTRNDTMRTKLVVALGSGRRRGSFKFSGSGVLGPLPTTTSTSTTSSTSSSTLETTTTTSSTSSTTTLETTSTTRAPSTTTSTSTSSTTTTTTLPAHCSNGVRDEDETAADCGGTACRPCADGLACGGARDCVSRFCAASVCANPCADKADGEPCPDDDQPCTVDACGGGSCRHVAGNAETVCRAAAGPCDTPEVCDGESPECPSDVLLPNGDTCRPAAGTCDEEEVCDGVSPACPADRFTRNGAMCRVPFGDCDARELCTGDSPTCPGDAVQPAGTACRPKAGECDVAETCDGTSKTCPDDSYETSGRVCRPATNPCENDAVCAGQDPDCLPNPPKPQGTPCRGRNGDCDVADTCDGSSRTCPDRLAPPSQPCRTATDECDVTEFCTGTSSVCPAESFAPAGTVCRPGQRPCEAAALCSGADPACPLNPRKPSGTVCRDSAGACDVADTCNGTSFDCPDTIEPAGTVCVSSTGPNGEYLCRNEVRCTGTSATCPSGIVSWDPSRICRASTAPCDPPEYCARGGECAQDVRWTVGQVCPGAAACEFDYTCDAAGSCNANGFRNDSASCRAPVDGSTGCDLRDFCGRDRTDRSTYPECGPDRKKADGTACQVGELAGTCSSGQCVAISTCKYDLDCPDGFLCNAGSCSAAPVDHGYGDACVGKKVCDANSKNPGAICTFPVDCRDATHPNGNCVPSSRGDCEGRQNGRNLVCCASMGGDGVGSAAAPGQIGRCQECCATDIQDNTATGCGEFRCCDGKCSDPDVDVNNCGGCAYSGAGTDCDDLREACTPSVEQCDAGSCTMRSACFNPNDPASIYDTCRADGTQALPNPQCNYCLPALTPDVGKHNTGCLSDADCGDAQNSCKLVEGRCSPDSLNPYRECDPTTSSGDLTCLGTCVGTCTFVRARPGGGVFFEHQYYSYVQTDACMTPPYTGCSIACIPDRDLCSTVVNGTVLPPNYNATCDNDDDCYCGLTCQSSCEYSATSNPIYFCFSPKTCQTPRS